MEFDFGQLYDYCGVNIKVIGVGGGGNNAVNRMISTNIRGVQFVAINTDGQALDSSCAATKMVIGEKITKGKGAGSNPEVGRRSAEESIDEIRALLEGTDMVFITAGMGGGTGTGAAPVIARVAREMDLLTVGIVTKPFSFEGARRMRQAEEGIAELNKYVDSLIVIPNDRLKNVEGTNITLANAFEIADDVLRRGVQSVSDLINIPAFINLDFADVSAIMKNAGYAHMGVGSAKGPDKAQLAAMAAISSPLLETNITGATGVIMSITTSPDVQLDEVMVASQLINDEAHPNANIIWGANLDPSLDDEIKVTIIATGFSSSLEDDVKEAIDTVTEKRFQTREKESSFVRPEIKEEPRYESVQRPAEEPAASVEVAREEPKTIINEIKSARTEEDEYATYENIFADLKRRSKK